jgi:hypothetical protein
MKSPSLNLFCLGAQASLPMGSEQGLEKRVQSCAVSKYFTGCITSPLVCRYFSRGVAAGQAGFDYNSQRGHLAIRNLRVSHARCFVPLLRGIFQSHPKLTKISYVAPPDQITSLLLLGFSLQKNTLTLASEAALKCWEAFCSDSITRDVLNAQLQTISATQERTPSFTLHYHRLEGSEFTPDRERPEFDITFNTTGGIRHRKIVIVKVSGNVGQAIARAYELSHQGRVFIRTPEKDLPIYLPWGFKKVAGSSSTLSTLVLTQHELWTTYTEATTVDAREAALQAINPSYSSPVNTSGPNLKKVAKTLFIEDTQGQCLVIPEVLGPDRIKEQVRAMVLARKDKPNWVMRILTLPSEVKAVIALGFVMESRVSDSDSISSQEPTESKENELVRVSYVLDEKAIPIWERILRAGKESEKAAGYRDLANLFKTPAASSGANLQPKYPLIPPSKGEFKSVPAKKGGVKEEFYNKKGQRVGSFRLNPDNGGELRIVELQLPKEYPSLVIIRIINWSFALGYAGKIIYTTPMLESDILSQRNEEIPKLVALGFIPDEEQCDDLFEKGLETPQQIYDFAKKKQAALEKNGVNLKLSPEAIRDWELYFQATTSSEKRVFLEGQIINFQKEILAFMKMGQDSPEILSVFLRKA